MLLNFLRSLSFQEGSSNSVIVNHNVNVSANLGKCFASFFS